MSNKLQQQNGEPATESDGPDYAAIEVPTDIPPSELHYTQRRTDILQQVMDMGHPAMLNQQELAEYYGVNQSTISRDLDRIDEYVRERLSRRRDLEMVSFLKRCMTDALEDGDYRAAIRGAEVYDSMLDERIDTLEFRRRLDRLEEIADREGQR